MKDRRNEIVEEQRRIEAMLSAVTDRSWDKMAELMRERMEGVIRDLRLYQGGDWREVGELQGRLEELVYFVGLRDKLLRDLEKTHKALQGLPS